MKNQRAGETAANLLRRELEDFRIPNPPLLGQQSSAVSVYFNRANLAAVAFGD